MYAVGAILVCHQTRRFDMFIQYFLAVLVSIQLSIFVLTNAMALWVDQLLHGVIKKLSAHTTVYDGTFILTTVVRRHYPIISLHLG